MTFVETNAEFEAWLRQQCAVVDDGLAAKHAKMASSAFHFLRCTFFRWAGRIGAVCPELADAPTVLCVADVHVENFGTWRDHEGRLVWGVNDFDEATVTPFAFGLVRLAASLRLAPDREVGNRDAAEVILDGYRRGLVVPRPTLLDEDELWMRPFVACTDKERASFRNEVAAYPAPEGHVPEAVEQGLLRSLPEGARITRLATRQAGGGSLGRPRYVAVASWRSGQIVREAKALVPSAWDWAQGNSAQGNSAQGSWAHRTAHGPSRFMELATGPTRAPDPFLAVNDGFVFRRLAADARKLELGPGRKLVLHERLLGAMGVELGAIHGNSEAAQEIWAFLERQPPGWLHRAAKTAAAAVEADFRKWKAQFRAHA